MQPKPRLGVFRFGLRLAIAWGLCCFCLSSCPAAAFQIASSRRAAALSAAVGLGSTSGPSSATAAASLRIGFGTSGIKEVALLALALRLGYRLLDTAAFYGNEEEVGDALKQLEADSALPLKPSVTTKVWWTEMSFDKATSSVQRSLQKLKAAVADLVLIHWPGQWLSGDAAGNREARKTTWEALCTLKQAGSIREIGVSNFTLRHLREMESFSSEMPAVNQVEFHPFFQQRDLVEYCQQKGIRIQAYSPLASGRLQLLNNPVLREVAGANGISPAQAVLKWMLQRGITPIVKTTSRARLQENLRAESLPDLSQSDSDAIAGLDRNESCDLSGGLVSPDRIA